MHRCSDRISPVGADVSSFGRKRFAVHILHGGYVHRLADSVSENPLFHESKAVIYRNCRRVRLDDDPDYDSGAVLSLRRAIPISCKAGADDPAPVITICLSLHCPECIF